jgi:hypothetical protein
MTFVLSVYVAVMIDICDSSCWAIGIYKNAKTFSKGEKVPALLPFIVIQIVIIS